MGEMEKSFGFPDGVGVCTKRMAEAPMAIRIATVAATMAKRRRGVGSNDDADGNSGISNDEETDDEDVDCGSSLMSY